jgi:ankyrin repeat protein
MSILHDSLNNNDEFSIEVLIRLNDQINIDLQDKKGRTCLHIACIKGYENIVDLLINYGCNIHLRDKNNYIALEHAFENNHINIAKKLLKLGLEKDKNKIIELFLSCFPDNQDYYNFDYDFDNIPDEGDDNKCNNKFGMFLISNGLSPNESNEKTSYENYNIFGYVCQMGYKKIVEHMIKNGAEINILFKKNNNTGTPLIYACRSHDIEVYGGGYSNIVKLLLENGANPNLNIEDPDHSHILNNCYPLESVCGVLEGYVNSKIAELLINYGANINKLNDSDHGPLFYMLARTDVHEINNKKIIDMLIKKGANLNELDYENDEEHGQIYLSQYLHSVDVISLLVDYGINVNQTNENGRTVFMLYEYIVFKDECVTNIDFLINKGGDLNLKDNDGNNALHYAAMNIDLDYIEFLIYKGMDPYEKNNQNKRVLDMFGDSYKDIEPFIGPLEKNSYESRKCKLTNDQKKYYKKIIKKMRKEYLDKKRRDENWERRKVFMTILSESGFKDESTEVVDTTVKIAGVKRNKEYLVKQVFTVNKRIITKASKNGCDTVERVMGFI